jgi:hypothetical protein
MIEWKRVVKMLNAQPAHYESLTSGYSKDIFEH